MDTAGNVWIAELRGKTHHYNAQTSKTHEIAHLPTSDPTKIEHGLLGIEVDPAFYQGQPYIYLYQTEASRTGSSGCFSTTRATSTINGNRAELIDVVLNGLSGEIEVLGKSHSSTMAAWANTLTNSEIAELRSQIRSN